MPLEISFSQFDTISSGTYNAGQIDYKGEGACNLLPRGV